MTLRDAKAGKFKAGKGFLMLTETNIMSIHAELAKFRLKRWGPNPREAPDSLLNSACRLSAIAAFRQLVSGAAFHNNNLELSYMTNGTLLTQAYNHYVHFVIETRVKAEDEKKGKHLSDAMRKSIQKNRERVSFGTRVVYPKLHLTVEIVFWSSSPRLDQRLH